MTYDSRCVLAH